MDDARPDQGARPKSLMQMAEASWVVKFLEGGELDTPLIEHASMQLARRWELSQLIRRVGHPEQVRAQQQELFRRMVFNILIDNTDDHEKNHALVRNADGFYALSPAFDVLPAAQGLGYQQMRVGAQGHEASITNALSEASAFGLRTDTAHSVVGLAHYLSRT